MTLVNFHMSHTLKHYSSKLDTVLKYPVSREELKVWWIREKDIVTGFQYLCTVCNEYSLCVQDEEGPMDGDVDTLVKMLIEAESRFKELSGMYDQHFERWSNLNQVGVLRVHKCTSAVVCHFVRLP